MKKYYILFIFCFLNIKLIYCQYNSVDECIQMVSNLVRQKSPESMNSKNWENTRGLIKKDCEDTFYHLPDSSEWFNKRDIIPNITKRKIQSGNDKGSASEILANKVVSLWDGICYKHGGNYGTCNDDNGWGNQKGVTWRGGCWKGYCWAGCFGGCSCIQKQVKEWCWTGTRNFGYKKCTKDSDCDINWSCAGTCSI